MISKDSVILRMSRNAKRLNLENEKKAAVVNNSSAITDLNIHQIRHGISSDGSPFSSYRSRKYAQFKRSLASYMAQYPTPDLYLTGSFIESSRTVVRGKEVVTESTDSKAQFLQKKYKPMGLTSESKAEATVLVTNSYTKSIANKLRK